MAIQRDRRIKPTKKCFFFEDFQHESLDMLGKDILVRGVFGAEQTFIDPQQSGPCVRMVSGEGIFAFFLESSFLGLYLFGRGRVSKGVHWFSILMVAVGATLSAFWILVANSWQQTPAGYQVVDGRAVLTSFYDVVFTSSMWPRFWHTMMAALVCGSFVMVGIAAVPVQSV